MSIQLVSLNNLFALSFFASECRIVVHKQYKANFVALQM